MTCQNPNLDEVSIKANSDCDISIPITSDDCVCYREIKDEEDTMKLKEILIDWVPGQGSEVWDFNLSNAI